MVTTSLKTLGESGFQGYHQLEGLQGIKSFTVYTVLSWEFPATVLHRADFPRSWFLAFRATRRLLWTFLHEESIVGKGAWGATTGKCTLAEISLKLWTSKVTANKNCDRYLTLRNFAVYEWIFFMYPPPNTGLLTNKGEWAKSRRVCLSVKSSLSWQCSYSKAPR